MEPPVLRARIVDLSKAVGDLDADEDAEEPAGRGEQDQDHGAGLGSGPVLRGEFGLGEAGAAAQPAPAVPGPDHAQVVAASGRRREREADQVSDRPVQQDRGDEGENVVPPVGEP
jgi:hypothetical protein